MRLGYALSSEEHPPAKLVEHAVTAERCGFEFAMISDHFHPWLGSQGQSPFVWTVIGAIAAKTESLELGTGVTCPLIRIHPAIIAQAAATAASLLPGRFLLGVGTGENLNEHILGDRWPSAGERRAMLEEALELMRELWRGELTSFDGRFYRAVDARLYTLPDDPIKVAVAAGGDRSAELAGRVGDALVTTSPSRDLVDAYEQAGGVGPKIGQATVCWAPTREEAVRTAMDFWPTAGLEGPLSQELALPSHFEAAVGMVSENDLVKKVPCGPDLSPVTELVGMFADAGFDAVYLHQVGPRQVEFLELAGESLVRAAAPAPAG